MEVKKDSLRGLEWNQKGHRVNSKRLRTLASDWLLDEDFKVLYVGAKGIRVEDTEGKQYTVDIKQCVWDGRMRELRIDYRNISEVRGRILYSFNQRFAWTIPQLEYLIRST